MGNNSYIIDSFYDERFSPNYSGENMRVGNQIFTIKGFTQEAMFNSPTVFAVRLFQVRYTQQMKAKDIRIKL